MNPYVRGTLFFLVFAGITTEGYFAARVLARRLEIERGFRAATVKSDEEIARHRLAEQERRAARAGLSSAILGWGGQWEFPPGGNVGSVNVLRNGQININGLGTNQGLKLVTQQGGGTAPILLQVFFVYSPTKSAYIGEFAVNAGQLQANSCVLSPTWFLQQEEFAEWDSSGGVRVRASIPVGGRNRFSSLSEALTRTVRSLQRTNSGIAEQTDLLAAAQAALEVRKNELQGDPNGPDVFSHPEYRIGLVAAINNIEDERNALQSAVDTLRRKVTAATDLRLQLTEELHSAAGATTNPPQLSVNQ